MTLPLIVFRKSKEFAHIEKDTSKWQEESEFIGLRNRSVRKSSYIQSEHSKSSNDSQLTIRTTNDFNSKWPVAIIGLMFTGVATVLIFSKYSQTTTDTATDTATHTAIPECQREFEVSLPRIKILELPRWIRTAGKAVLSSRRKSHAACGRRLLLRS